MAKDGKDSLKMRKQQYTVAAEHVFSGEMFL